VDDGRDAAPGETNGGGKAGHAGTDDVDGLRHQMNA
jgi:hypothetical protein